MRKLWIAVALASLTSCSERAEQVGVSMAIYDDKFMTVLRSGMQDHADSLATVSLQSEDAQNDVARQLSQIQNFIAQQVIAVIINPVDTDATPAMTRLAAEAGIPLVYVNRVPADLDKLPRTAAFVGSDEGEAGSLQAREVCRLLREAGKKEARVLVMMGELSNQAARQRTQAVQDVFGTPDCPNVQIVARQTGNWRRTEGQDLMTNWISAGIRFDAVVSNNDEMAIGAIQALKAAGYDRSTVIVAGIDGTRDALAVMKAGDLDVTVFQNAAAQGRSAVDAALKLARGEAVAQTVWIPFELVTPAKADEYMTRN